MSQEVGQVVELGRESRESRQIPRTRRLRSDADGLSGIEEAQRENAIFFVAVVLIRRKDRYRLILQNRLRQ